MSPFITDVIPMSIERSTSLQSDTRICPFGFWVILSCSEPEPRPSYLESIRLNVSVGNQSIVVDKYGHGLWNGQSRYFDMQKLRAVTKDLGWSRTGPTIKKLYTVMNLLDHPIAMSRPGRSPIAKILPGGQFVGECPLQEYVISDGRKFLFLNPYTQKITMPFGRSNLVTIRRTETTKTSLRFEVSE
jgi:hypothetical protein